MIAESTVVDPELTPKVKALLREAGQRLTGPERRAFFAQVAAAFFGGSARRTESHFGWSRFTVEQGQKGTPERHRGFGRLPGARQPSHRGQVAGPGARRAGSRRCPRAG